METTSKTSTVSPEVKKDIITKVLVALVIVGVVFGTVYEFVLVNRQIVQLDSTVSQIVPVTQATYGYLNDGIDSGLLPSPTKFATSTMK